FGEARNFAHEAIANTWDRFDIARRGGFLAQSFAKRRNVSVEIVLLDVGFRPQGGEKFVLGKERAVVAHQNAEGLESFARQRNGAFAAKQTMLLHFQSERPELIDNTGVE